MPATDEEVEAAHDEVVELRDELADAIQEQQVIEASYTNDIQLEQLENEADNLRTQIEAVRAGGSAVPQVTEPRHDEEEVVDETPVVPPDEPEVPPDEPGVPPVEENQE